MNYFNFQNPWILVSFWIFQVVQFIKKNSTGNCTCNKVEIKFKINTSLIKFYVQQQKKHHGLLNV